MRSVLVQRVLGAICLVLLLPVAFFALMCLPVYAQEPGLWIMDQGTLHMSKLLLGLGTLLSVGAAVIGVGAGLFVTLVWGWGAFNLLGKKVRFADLFPAGKPA